VRERPIISAKVSLTAGSRLGPYEILSPLGAGGMDEMSGLAVCCRDRLAPLRSPLRFEVFGGTMQEPLL
jgi:hypothetical protein